MHKAQHNSVHRTRDQGIIKSKATGSERGQKKGVKVTVFIFPNVTRAAPGKYVCVGLCLGSFLGRFDFLRI